MMKILILANYDLGLYRFRKELISELIKKHTVIISLPYGELIDPLVSQGCIFLETPMDRRGINPFTDLQLINRYRKIMREVRPDLVITYTIKPNIYGGMICRMLHIPYAANITGLGTAFAHEGPLKQMVMTMYRSSLKKAKVVYTENKSIRKVLVSQKIVSESRICVLNGAGVNLQDFSYMDYPENSVFSFLFIGRVMKEKGVEELFAAMKRLHDEGHTCLLHLVGLTEEDYQDKIRQGCRQGWLIDHGPQKDVRPFIAAADCFVLPSWHEGMANTNLECAASGRPVITSSIPGCREAVVDGRNGFLCESRNVDSLYKAMLRMMELPREERIRMGKAGRRHMEKHFDKRIVVRQTMDRLF